MKAEGSTGTAVTGTRSIDLPTEPVKRPAHWPERVVRNRTWGTVRLPTMAELGQLQGFPPDYPWPDGPGERRDTALRIGNAVPPQMYAGLVRDVLTRPAATS